jgi:hypothetical protein
MYPDTPDWFMDQYADHANHENNSFVRQHFAARLIKVRNLLDKRTDTGEYIYT